MPVDIGGESVDEEIINTVRKAKLRLNVAKEIYELLSDKYDEADATNRAGFQQAMNVVSNEIKALERVYNAVCVTLGDSI